MDIDYQGDVIAQLREVGGRDYIVNPDWNSGGYVHNWKGYIDVGLRHVWGELSAEARGMAYLFAESQAGSEEWD